MYVWTRGHFLTLCKALMLAFLSQSRATTSGWPNNAAAIREVTPSYQGGIKYVISYMFHAYRWIFKALNDHCTEQILDRPHYRPYHTGCCSCLPYPWSLCLPPGPGESPRSWRGLYEQHDRVRCVHPVTICRNKTQNQVLAELKLRLIHTLQIAYQYENVH